MGALLLKENVFLLLALVSISYLINGSLSVPFGPPHSKHISFAQEFSNFGPFIKSLHRFGHREPPSLRHQRVEYDAKFAKRNAPFIVEALPAAPALPAPAVRQDDVFSKSYNCQSQTMMATAKSGHRKTLNCEVWLPQESVIEWYKDDERLRSTKIFSRSSVGENQPMSLQQPQILIKSIYYIDCPYQEDEGNYMIKVTTSDGRSFHRNFTLSVIESSDDGFCCGLFCEGFRVTEFAKKVEARKGQRVTLPCKYEGDVLDRGWKKLERHEDLEQALWIQNDEEHYQVEENGNLVIPSVSKDDMRMFGCVTYGPRYRYRQFHTTFDPILVIVQVLD